MKKGNIIFDFFRQFFKLRIFESMIIPFTKGAAFGSFFFKIPPNPYQYPKNSYRKVLRNGISLFLDISDVVDWSIYFDFEDKTFQEIERLTKKGDTIIDIGANIGYVSLLCSQKTKANGKIYGFEPDRYNRDKFKKNSSLNTDLAVEIVPMAVGAKRGWVSMDVRKSHNRGMNQVIENLDRQSTSVELITLDEFVTSKSITKVDLIKIDVEGYEMDVLKGGENMLTSFLPKLVVEVDDKNLIQYGSSAFELIALLEKKGYSLYNADTKKTVSSQDNMSNCHFDIVGIPKVK